MHLSLTESSSSYIRRASFFNFPNEKHFLIRYSQPLVEGFLKSLKRLLTNKLYVVLVLVTCFALFVVSGLAAFKPKYLEHQFGISASKSNMVLGLSGALPAFLGSGFSGIIMSKLKLGVISTAKFCTLLYVITAISQSMLVVFGCPQPNTAGFRGVESSRQLYYNGDNSTSCADVCKCTNGRFSPVCGDDDVMYYSACYAGCQKSNISGKATTFSECSCIPDAGSAVSGVCDTTCGMLIPYAVFTFCGAFAGAMSIVPKIILSIRVVEPRDKALSLGVTMFSFSIFSFPSPVIIGAIFDSFCLIKDSLGCGRDVCVLYDRDGLRYGIMSIMGVMRTLMILPIIYVWYDLVKQAKRQEAKKENEERKGVMPVIQVTGAEPETLNVGSKDDISAAMQGSCRDLSNVGI
ncbi:solute carrier organic anion transporter family member 74D-like [Lineus longissimus]|uniref:solute carrier organic anion transporter family member 74D-like n=1 Tax=Lineus longissimus TaxID=88925 RepID=UPI00315D4BAC